jgi:hypothetical protein
MNTNPRQTQVLFSEELVGKNLGSPVIVVGLPRSGSSYLAHLLSCTQDWFVFDDLYPYQKAARHGLIGVNDLSQKKHLIKAYLNSLGWSLRTKINFEKNFSSQTFAGLTVQDVEKMQVSIFQSIQNQPNLTWATILDEWMTRLSLYLGKSQWGYKTPKDYLHLKELTDVFPNMKVIFLFRNPLNVMQSYKSLPRDQVAGGDGVSRQYHPLIYALYWRDAYVKTMTFKSKTATELNLLKVKFEEMVGDTDTTAKKIAEFLDSSIIKETKVQSTNSSMFQGSKRELTELEKYICLLINRDIMSNENYPITHNKLKIVDFLALIGNSVDFCAYQIESILIRPKLRMDAIQSFTKSVVGKH